MRKMMLALSALFVFGFSHNGYTQNILQGNANSSLPYVYVPPIPPGVRNMMRNTAVFEMNRRIINLQTTRGMWGTAKNAYYYSKAAVGPAAIGMGVAATSGGMAGAFLFPKREYVPQSRYNSFRGPVNYLPRNMMTKPHLYGLQRGLRRR